MKRKFLPAMIALIFILLVAVPSGFAQSPKEDPNKLKKSEHEALLNQVGMSEKDISNLPVSELRKLLANGAKKIASNEVTHTFSDNPSASDDIGTYSLVKGVDINLGALLILWDLTNQETKNMQFMGISLGCTVHHGN